MSAGHRLAMTGHFGRRLDEREQDEWLRLFDQFERFGPLSPRQRAARKALRHVRDMRNRAREYRTEAQA